MRLSILLISIIGIVMIISTVSALPEILGGFNAKYNTIGTRLDTCDTCHIPGKPQRQTCDEVCHIPNKPQKEPNSLNPYGTSIKNNLNVEINQAFNIIENLDSDGDRFTNIEEIHNLTFPGNRNDKPKKNVNLLSNIENILEFLKIP